MTHTSTEQLEPRYADVVHHANVHPSLSYVARKTGLCYQETTRLLELALERGDLASGDYAGRNLDLYVADREKALTQEVEQLRARVQELEAAQARVPLSDYKQALDFLAGLHPGITIDGPPMAVAELIFDAVQAEQRALKEEIERKERNLDWMRKELAKRTLKSKDCARPACMARGCFGYCMKGITQEKQG